MDSRRQFTRREISYIIQDSNIWLTDGRQTLTWVYFLVTSGNSEISPAGYSLPWLWCFTFSWKSIHYKSIYYISHLNPLTTFTYPCEVFLLLPYTQLNFLSAIPLIHVFLQTWAWSKFFFELELGIDCLFFSHASFGLSSSLFGYWHVNVWWVHSSIWLTLLYVTCLYILHKGDGGIWFQCNYHLNYKLHLT